uniref:Uncharacterized protein n=3 Tax=Rhizophora mucronata TaxID=61149 RepID=A0A2P2KT64_RHIMU
MALVNCLRPLIVLYCIVIGGLDVDMVSLRRRRLIALHGRSLAYIPLPDDPDGNISEVPEQDHIPVSEDPEQDRIPVSEDPEQDLNPLSVHCQPSLALNPLFEVKQEKEVLAMPLEKKLKITVQIHPDRPLEVHAYLRQLKEENKLDIGLLQRSEAIPVKEWMENRFPHILAVFPQDPKLFFPCPDKAKQSELLYCYYCLFLFEVRNIVFLDCRVSPKYVESLGHVIKDLEKQGFDCRFMRSELLVFGYMMKKQKEVIVAEKHMIATRTINLEKRLRAATMKVKEAELDEQEKQTEGITPEMGKPPDEPNKLPGGQHKRELNMLPYPTLEQECIESVLDCHKKMLARKDEEWIRLDRVLEKISQMHRGKAVFPGK